MRTTTPTRALTATAALAALLLALPAAAQSAGDVEVVDSAFQPAEVTIDAGGTVTWTQTGNLPHSVTADDGSFDSHSDCSGGSGCMGAGDTFSETFDEPGEHAYYCRIHGAPGGVGMSGVVTVAAVGAGPTEPAQPTETTPPAETPEPTEQPGGEAEVTGSLVAPDQSGEGSTVLVDEVTISGATGFVVVHADADGAPGTVLGHVAIAEGTSRDVAVRLDAPLTGDATVWPMLHVDAGQVGVYEFPGPDGPVTADGAVVMSPVAVTLAAADDDTDAGSLPRTGTPLGLLALAAMAALAGGAVAVRRRTA